MHTHACGMSADSEALNGFEDQSSVCDEVALAASLSSQGSGFAVWGSLKGSLGFRVFPCLFG